MIPLPKEAIIERKITVPVASVAVIATPGSSDLVRAEVEALLAENTGDVEFTIIAGALDRGELDGRSIEDAGRLDGLRNSEQAYLIRSLDDRTLAVTGLSPAGVFYGLSSTGRTFPSAASGAGRPTATSSGWPSAR